jgi:hypothetical protein
MLAFFMAYLKKATEKLQQSSGFDKFLGGFGLFHAL